MIFMSFSRPLPTNCCIVCTKKTLGVKVVVKILIYGLNYSPELTGIGKYTSEMTEWLARQGHEVRVVTTPPYYPEWKIGVGYRAGSYRHETLKGVPVWRTPLWVPTKQSGVRRLIHLMTFALSSVPVLVRQMFWRPDVVWVAAPAFFCAPGAWFTARLSGAKAWMHVQDYEIDAAFELGLLKGERLRGLVLAAERWIFRRFDRVSTISDRMLDKARQKDVAPGRLRLFRNWVDTSSIRPLSGPSRYRARLGVPETAAVALYSGNMGAKQGLEVLSDVARILQNETNLHFVFCGNGAGRGQLTEACKGLARVHFLDLQPLEELEQLLGLADVHLLPQRGDAADLVMPSKLTGMFASGRAVVAAARPGTELASTVAGRGLVVEPEQPSAMAAAVLQLVEQVDLRRQLGAEARRFAEATLDREAVLRRFESDLLDCIGSRD